METDNLVMAVEYNQDPEITYITPPHLAKPSRMAGERAIISEVRTILNRIPSAKQVVDIACGAGEYRFLFPGMEYLGIDVVDNNFKEKEDERTKFQICDVANMNTVPNDYTDIVFCIYSFHLFADPEASLGEIRRILRPGGYALICLPQKYVQMHYLPLYWLYRLGFIELRNVYPSGRFARSFYSPQKMAALAQSAGLSVEKVIVGSGPLVSSYQLVLIWYRILRACIVEVSFGMIRKAFRLGTKGLSLQRKWQGIDTEWQIDHVRSLGELKEIQHRYHSSANLLDKIYVAIVSFLNNIEIKLKLKPRVEYIIILKKQ